VNLPIISHLLPLAPPQLLVGVALEEEDLIVAEVLDVLVVDRVVERLVRERLELEDDPLLVDTVLESLELEDNVLLLDVVLESLELEDNVLLLDVVLESLELEDNVLLLDVVLESLELEVDVLILDVVLESLELEDDSMLLDEVLDSALEVWLAEELIDTLLEVPVVCETGNEVDDDSEVDVELAASPNVRYQFLRSVSPRHSPAVTPLHPLSLIRSKK
jgi:hypothetical protein